MSVAQRPSKLLRIETLMLGCVQSSDDVLLLSLLVSSFLSFLFRSDFSLFSFFVFFFLGCGSTSSLAASSNLPTEPVCLGCVSSLGLSWSAASSNFRFPPDVENFEVFRAAFARSFAIISVSFVLTSLLSARSDRMLLPVSV